MSQRRAVTKTIATRYRRADKAAKGVILDEVCATTGWHRSHARKALTQALRPKIVRLSVVECSFRRGDHRTRPLSPSRPMPGG